MSKFFRIAFKMSKYSNHKLHKHASLVCRGGAIISSATNLAYRECGHAERRALRPKRDFSGASLYIVRQSGGLSKPCKACAEVIVNAGIKKVYFIDENRNFTCIKARDLVSL